MSLRLHSLRNGEKNDASFGFTTIQAFKGMEAPAVILTDVVKITGEKAEALLYVGMSRARLRLIMLMHENCRAQYVNAIQDGFMSKTKGRN
jgi:superfamily I DNA/RNA helicase